MNVVGEFLGEICKTIFPIEEKIFYGNENSPIAICTLSSMSLLKEIKNSELVNEISIVGRLLSENKGIDSLIQTVIVNKNLKTIILCGKEVVGHNAGSALLLLHKNGIDNNGKIIGSTSPDPILASKPNHVKKFQNQVNIINKIGNSNFQEIIKTVNSIKS